MLNNPNEWHNIEDEENEQSVSPVEVSSAPNNAGTNTGKIKAAIFAFVIFLAAGIAIANKVKSHNEQIPAYEQNQQQISINPATGNPEDINAETVEIPIEIPSDGQQAAGQNKLDDKLNPKDSVLISVGGEGRENPFLPYITVPSSVATGSSYSSGSYRGGYGIPFDVIEPPQKIINDTRAENLMATTVSGILYDSKNPSAIINYNGEDQMVRKGDKLSNFTILDITKSKVVVKTGTNIYMASVGQALQDESDININEVYNLQRKFGGAYASEVPRGILIKPIIRPN